MLTAICAAISPVASARVCVFHAHAKTNGVRKAKREFDPQGMDSRLQCPIADVVMQAGMNRKVGLLLSDEQ